MKQVSDAYKLSMRSMLRNRSYVKVAFSNVDVAAATDGEWESNGAQGYSEFDTIDYEWNSVYAAQVNLLVTTRRHGILKC